jgi:AcrR family transcriptional regulator
VSKPSPGRPRSGEARSAILEAATELVRERGLLDMTIDEVARRAGVGKSTIYRWWPSKELLALDALSAQLTDVSLGEVGARATLRDDLVARAEIRLRAFRERPWLAGVVAAFLAHAHRDPEFAAALLQRVVEPRRAIVRSSVQRAIEEGELPAGTDAEFATDLVLGPIWHRMLQGHGPVDQPFVERVIDCALAGLGWKPPPA